MDDSSSRDGTLHVFCKVIRIGFWAIRCFRWETTTEKRWSWCINERISIDCVPFDLPCMITFDRWFFFFCFFVTFFVCVKIQAKRKCIYLTFEHKGRFNVEQHQWKKKSEVSWCSKMVNATKQKSISTQKGNSFTITAKNVCA